MATTTGNDYDHITLSNGTDSTIHYLKDTVAREDLIKVKNQIGVSEVTTGFTTGKYIATSGTTVDITTLVTNGQFMCGVFDCSEGDYFTITGSAGSTPRLWCFIDSSGNSLEVAANGATGNETIIRAPKNTVKLVVNFVAANTHELINGAYPVKRLNSLDKYVDDRPVIYPTGDTTNRLSEINKMLSVNNELFFPEGTYYINTTLTLPNGTHIHGAGEKTIIRYADSGVGSSVIAGENCIIENIVLDGGLRAKPSDYVNRVGIYVSDNKQTLRVDNVKIIGFGGIGIEVINTGYNGLSSIQVTNCLFQYNNQGIRFNEHGEFGLVTNSTFIDNKIGINCSGGNNVVTGCVIARNTTGFYCNGDNIDNSAHGILSGCEIVHNTENGVQILNTTNGYVITNCSIGRNEVRDLTINASGVNIVGCNFMLSSMLLFAELTRCQILDCMFMGNPTVNYLSGAIVRKHNNRTRDGKKLTTLNDDEDFMIGDYPVVNAYIDINGKWGYVGNTQTESAVIPLKAGDGITIIGQDAVQTYYGFVETYPSGIEQGGAVNFADADGFTAVFPPDNSIPRSFTVPEGANYLVALLKVNGSDRHPQSIIINGFDIVNGTYVKNALYGGTSGVMNTALTKSSKLICTIIDDDAQNTASMQALYEVCEDNDVKCTIASLTDKWGIDSDLKQKLYDMESAGYHIVLHGYNQDSNNPWDDIDTRVSDYEANFVHGLRDLHQAGFANCDFWVTPAGIRNLSAQRFARKYGMKAMIIGVNGINLIDATNTISGTDTGNLTYWDGSRYLIRRANLRYEDDVDWTLQNLKDIANRGTNHGAWLVLCTHAYQWYNDATKRAAFESRYAEFIAYAKSLGYEFMTLGEAWSYREAAYNLYDMR